MKINFFRIQQTHRVFHYKPMYYDAKKEELQERIKRIEEGLEPQNGEKKEYKFDRSRINFRKAFAEQKVKEEKPPFRRALTYMAVILFVALLYCFIRYFVILFNPDIYKSKANVEAVEKSQSQDMDPDTRIIIVDDDVDVTKDEPTASE